VLASWIALLLCRDGSLDRLEAAFFLSAMFAFVGYSVWVARTAVGPAEEDLIVEEMVPHRAIGLGQRPAWLLGVGLCVALGGLLLGAQGLVRGAESLAHALGISERVVGLTVVAIGTSLPELAVTLAAALKKQQEMAIATVVGSNIFNLLMILGAAGLVHPLVFDARMAALDLWVMMALTMLLFPLVVRVELVPRRGGGSLLYVHAGALSRGRGAILLLAYAGYIVWLARHAAV
jgi:cation:H+ antiporter